MRPEFPPRHSLILHSLTLHSLILQSLILHSLTQPPKTQPPKPGATRTTRDRAPGTCRTKRGPARRPDSAARHSDASCQRSNSKFRRTRPYRTGNQGQIPARAWPGAIAHDCRVEAVKSPEPALRRSRQSAGPPQSRPANKARAAERSGSAAPPTQAPAPRLFDGF